MPGNNENNPKKKSLLETYAEAKEKERVEEIKRESEREAARAERERKAREQYAERLSRERLELLKLKQGVISEEDMPAEVKEEKHYTVRQKIGNFFYHNRLYIIITAATALLMAFLLYDLLSKVSPDVTVMFIATDDTVQFITAGMEAALEPYCADCNGDGRIKVRMLYVPAGNPIPEGGGVNSFAVQELQANRTKLISEFQSTDTIMIIADKQSCDEAGVNGDIFAELGEIFPNDENVDGQFYMLKGTSFGADIGYEGLSDDLFLAFRRPHKGMGINVEKFDKNFDNAVELWRNYINGNVVNPTEEDTGK